MKNTPKNQTFYRGGPESNFSEVRSIQAILEYENIELGNLDVELTPEGEAYKHLPPVQSLTWVTKSRNSAKEYGPVEQITLKDPVILMQDGYEGLLVAERKYLEAISHYQDESDKTTKDSKNSNIVSFKKNNT